MKKVAPKVEFSDDLIRSAIISGALEGLTQTELGEKFGHDKTWVAHKCRKLGLKWKDLIRGNVDTTFEEVEKKKKKLKKKRRGNYRGAQDGEKLSPKVVTTFPESFQKSPKVAKSPIPQDPPVINNTRSMFVEVSENALEQYVLYLANTCDPSPQIASLMKDILKEKRAFVQAKGGITELSTDEVQALMGEIPQIPAEKRKDEPEGD